MLCSYSVQGTLYTEHINMLPPVANDKMLFPQMVGGLTAHLNVSWSACWWFCGSSNLVLDLIWTTCSKSPLSPSTNLGILKSNLLGLVSLLAAVVKSSPNHREAFIQGHGFHLLSLCLEELADRIKSLDAEARAACMDAIFSTMIVDKCFDTLTALGMDGHQGDGMVAALQGLLLNFKLWAIASEDTLDYLLTRTAAIVYADSGMELYRSIGIQKLIDLLRLFIAPNVPELSLPVSFEPSVQRVVSSGLRLLHVALEASFTSHLSINTENSDMLGIDLLISALDDNLHMLLVEGFLQMLNEIRFNYPAQLQRAFKLAKFLEVGCVLLLCRTDLSLEARRLVTLLMLWYFHETTKSIPSELSKLRFKCLLLYNAALLPPSAANMRKAKYRLNMDGSLEQIKPMLESIGRHWYLARMLSECVQWSMEEYVSRRSAEDIMKVSDGLLEILYEDGTLGRLPVWLTLPFLAALFPTSSPTLAQQILMSASVHLKTDEGVQCEVFCSLEDWSWIDLFIDIALFGCSEANPDRAEIVGSYFEISLESLATIIEHKVRNHDDDAWVIWRIFVEKTKEFCTSSVQLKMTKRCVIIVFQRLCRSNGKWPYTLVSNVGKIFLLLESDQLMGNSPVNDEVLERSRSEENVLGLEYVRNASVLSKELEVDQIQMVGLMIDLMGKIRFAAKEQDLNGYELLALQPALRILLGCVITNSNELSDHICHELHTFLKYLTGNVAVCSVENFNKFILVVFGMLKYAIHHPDLSESVRGKYTALVYSYLHHFYDLKYTFIHSGKHVPDHVVNIMNAVTSMDSHNIDVETVFALFKISLQNEDVISFADDMTNEDKPTQNAPSPSNLSPKSLRKSAPIEFLTPIPEGNVPDTEARRMFFSADSLNDTFVAAKSSGAAQSRGYAYSVDETDGNNSEASFGMMPDVIKTSEQSSFFVKDPIRLKYFLHWKRKRLTIAEKFVLVERERLKKFKSAVMFKAKVARRFWTKIKRKLESEVLNLMNFESSWKLGTDECVFPGRERVVLRRKYNTSDDRSHRIEASATLSMEKMNEVLANYINKPAFDAVTPEDEKGEPEIYDDGEEAINDKDNAKADAADDDLCEQNRIVTGPCHSGARRSNFGAVKDEAEVTLVTPSGNYAGSIAFSKKDVSFISRNSVLSEEDYGAIAADSNKKFTRRRWTVSAISQIFLRRYRLRDTALEVFFRRGKHRNFFIDFGHTEDARRRRDEFARNLMRNAPKSTFKQWPSMSPFRVVSELGVLAQWQRGELSNFEYLMALNTAAGRTYNDLCQVSV